MKIRIRASELTDAAIDFVSLVKNGANRSSFKIVKADQPKNVWAGLCPELERLETRFDDKPITKEAPTMNRSTAQLRKNEEHAARVEALRGRLSTLNGQLLRLWENPQHPLFNQLDADLTMQIEKCELELSTLIDDSHEMDQRSAFFYRGGSSVYSAANLYDSAEDRGAGVQKAEQRISLETPLTQADFDDSADEVSKVDLGSLKF